jgi:hypothetical protein
MGVSEARTEYCPLTDYARQRKQLQLQLALKTKVSIIGLENHRRLSNTDAGNRPISPELGSSEPSLSVFVLYHTHLPTAPPASTPTAMAQRLAEMRFMMRVDGRC